MRSIDAEKRLETRRFTPGPPSADHEWPSSPFHQDEKTLYVTNGPTLAAFDVRSDGSLANRREFAKLEGGGNGDGSTIDAAGRIYVTTNPGVQVIGPDGKYLGIIPSPRPVISVAFGGPDKKTLYVLARGATSANGDEVANAAQVYAIQMIAQGFKGRPK